MDFKNLKVKSITTTETEKDDGTIEQKTVNIKGIHDGIPVVITIQSDPRVLKEFFHGETIGLTITRSQQKLG